LCALLGAGVLILYFSQSQAAVLPQGEGELAQLFFLAMATLMLGGLGYAAGTRAAKTLGGWPTICWMLVLYLPLSAVMFGFFGYQELAVSSGLINAGSISEPSMDNLVGGNAYDLNAWVCILYLALVSQWWGFRFLYTAMAQAGAGTVGQIQLLQPFFTLLFSAWLLLEPLHFSQFAFLVLILCLVAGAIKFK